MKVATLDLTPELFVEFCKTCKSGLTRRFIVKENPLPDDAEIVRIGLNAPYGPYNLRLYISSESFADVPEGSTPPELPLVVFETIFDTDDTRPDGYCRGGCGLNFYEFPEMRHAVDHCPGPECTCYEVTGGHQMGCYFYAKAGSVQ